MCSGGYVDVLRDIWVHSGPSGSVYCRQALHKTFVLQRHQVINVVVGPKVVQQGPKARGSLSRLLVSSQRYPAKDVSFAGDVMMGETTSTTGLRTPVKALDP